MHDSTRYFERVERNFSLYLREDLFESLFYDEIVINSVLRLWSIIFCFYEVLRFNWHRSVADDRRSFDKVG